MALARILHPLVPSKTRTDFRPSTVTSNRVRSGRFCASRNGTRRPPQFALSTRPLQAMVSILRQASRPPRAAAFLSTTWAAVRAGAVAGSSANTAAAAATTAQAGKCFIDMAGWAYFATSLPDPSCGLANRLSSSGGLTLIAWIVILCEPFTLSTTVSIVCGNCSPPTGLKSR